MNMLTKVVECKAFAEDVNLEIQKNEKEEWRLRGTPTYIGEGHVLLTFEIFDETFQVKESGKTSLFLDEKSGRTTLKSK